MFTKLVFPSFAATGNVGKNAAKLTKFRYNTTLKGMLSRKNSKKR